MLKLKLKMWQVMVKCHLKDDDAEEVEILELPSGCVRCQAAMAAMAAAGVYGFALDLEGHI